MIATVSVATLRGEIIELLDATSAQTISTTYINRLIKRKLAKTYNLLVGLNESYFVTSVSATCPTSGVINLDSAMATTVSCMKIVKILYKSSDETYELPEMHMSDYALEVHNRETVDPTALKWLVRGNKLLFNGAPNTSCTLYIWYIPVWNDATTSSAAIAWRLPYNWTDLVVYGVCADLRERSEEDYRYFEGKYQEAKREIFDEAMNRSLVSDAVVWDAFNRWG